MRIVRVINARLSPERKVLAKTPPKNISGPGQEYYLLDCQTGEIKFMSLEDVAALARELGAG